MKILKKLGLVALFLIAAFLIAGLFVDTSVKAERSLVMNAPAALPFEQVNDLKNWEKWGPWQKKDETMKISYGAKSVGPGASYSWVSEHSGNGKLTILKSESNHLIETQIEFDGQGGADGGWDFVPEGDNTKVTWRFAFEMPYPFNAMRLFSDPEQSLDEMFDEGLAAMKTIVEKKAADAAAAEAAAKQMQIDSLQANPIDGEE